MLKFRTVIIKKRAKLEYQLNYFVVRGETEKRVHLSEIHTIIIENTATVVTTVLLCELMKRNIQIIFCDEKHIPCFSCVPFSGNYENSKRVKQQFAWDELTKSILWKNIIVEKIKNQAKILKNNDAMSAILLNSYSENVCDNDSTNREGHAAKVYFNVLFGKSFSRKDKENPINIALNYGYTILLSTITRNIVAAGYLPQIGIWHDSDTNPFNLSSDLIEPLRQIVDYTVLHMEDYTKFKEELNKLLSLNVTIGEINTTLEKAVTIYVRSIIKVLETGSFEELRFVKFNEF